MEWNDKGEILVYGSLTFIKGSEKTLEIHAGVPFECSGGTINRYIRLPWCADDVLFVSNGEKGDRLRYLWRKEWTTQETLAAHRME